MPKAKEHIPLNADQSAEFERLCTEARPYVYRLVLPLTNYCSEDAEDITQDAFIKAQRNFHNFRGDSTFSTWVCTIARNLKKDQVRRPDQRIQFTSIDDAGENDEQMPLQIADPRRGPEAELFRNGHFLPEFLPKLEKAVKALPRARQRALMLSLEELSMNEIAERSGCNANTAKSNLFKAKKELRQRLNPPRPVKESMSLQA